MSSFSDYLEKEILDHMLNVGTDYSRPASVWAALYSGVPSDTGGGTEMVGTGYGRQQISFGAPGSRMISNDTALTWTAGGADWEAIIAVGIFDAETSGNLLAWDGVTSKTIGSGESYVIAIGDLDVSVPTGTTEGMTTDTVHTMLTFVFDAGTWSVAANPWVALLSASPTDAGTITAEEDGTGYGRIQVAWDAATGTDAMCDNTSQFEYTATIADWNTETYLAVCASGTETTADILWYGPLSSSALPGAGDKIRFAAGAVTLTLT